MDERYVSIFDECIRTSENVHQGQKFYVKTYNLPIGKYKIISYGYFDNEGVDIGTDIIEDYCDNYLYTPMGQLTEIIINVVSDDVPQSIPYEGEVFVHAKDMEIVMWCVEGYEYDLLRIETYEEVSTEPTTAGTLVPSDEMYMQLNSIILSAGAVLTCTIGCVFGAVGAMSFWRRWRT